jgi:hypothetical protein
VRSLGSDKTRRKIEEQRKRNNNIRGDRQKRLAGWQC